MDPNNVNNNDNEDKKKPKIKKRSPRIVSKSFIPKKTLSSSTEIEINNRNSSENIILSRKFLIQTRDILYYKKNENQVITIQKFIKMHLAIKEKKKLGKIKKKKINKTEK